MKTKFNEFDIENKLKLLRGYINILKNDVNGVNVEMAIQYFIILHNFLLVERMFYDDIVASDKELNTNLKLEKLNNTKDIMVKFTELYDRYSKVRFAVETFDSIESVRNYLEKRPELYNKLLKK